MASDGASTGEEGLQEDAGHDKGGKGVVAGKGPLRPPRGVRKGRSAHRRYRRAGGNEEWVETRKARPRL
jgi:hypothetical protein